MKLTEIQMGMNCMRILLQVRKNFYGPVAIDGRYEPSAVINFLYKDIFLKLQ